MNSRTLSVVGGSGIQSCSYRMIVESGILGRARPVAFLNFVAMYNIYYINTSCIRLNCANTRTHALRDTWTSLTSFHVGVVEG
jgi:hypothetical protein